jgi:hypothetical protein
MNPKANIIRRFAGDFVQRLRVALGTHADGAVIVDQLDSDTAERIASNVCADLGVEYEPKPAHDPKPDGKPGAEARAKSPWQKNHGIRYGKRTGGQ